MSIIKLLDGNGWIDSGSVTFNGRDILNCTDKEMYHIRGNEISVIFQEPMTSLNPVFTVERQIGEVLTHPPEYVQKGSPPPRRSLCWRMSKSPTRSVWPNSTRSSCPAVCASVS